VFQSRPSEQAESRNYAPAFLTDSPASGTVARFRNLLVPSGGFFIPSPPPLQNTPSSRGEQQVVPLTSPAVTIYKSPGDQTNPHAVKDLQCDPARGLGTSAVPYR
jgi:hypothetical protein